MMRSMFMNTCINRTSTAPGHAYPIDIGSIALRPHCEFPHCEFPSVVNACLEDEWARRDPTERTKKIRKRHSPSRLPER
jgi:hypothetical protein